MSQLRAEIKETLRDDVDHEARTLQTPAHSEEVRSTDVNYENFVNDISLTQTPNGVIEVNVDGSYFDVLMPAATLTVHPNVLVTGLGGDDVFTVNGINCCVARFTLPSKFRLYLPVWKLMC